jgi:hypothetical protein
MRKILVFILFFLVIQSLKSNTQKDLENKEKVVLEGNMYLKNKDVEPIKFSLVEKEKGTYSLILIQTNKNDSLLKNGEIVKSVFKKEIDSKLTSFLLKNEKDELYFLIYFSDHQLGKIGKVRLKILVYSTLNKVEKELNCSIKVEHYIL